MAKYYDKRTLNHEQALAWVKQQTIGMGFGFNETHLEAGIDAFAELADPKTGAAQANFLGIQVKTCERFDAESPEKFSFYADGDDINYWNSSNIPVLLVVCRAKTEEAYAVWVRDYFKQNKGSKTVVFNKDHDRFKGGETWQRRLLGVGISRKCGFSFPAVPKPEELASNLLEVVPPENIFSGETRFKSRDAILKILKEREFRGIEFIVRDGHVWSTRSLHLDVWNTLVDSRTIAIASFAELGLHENQAVRRHAVELLNYCLESRLAKEDVLWLEEERLYVYLPDRSPRRSVRTTVSREDGESKKGLLHVTSRGEKVRWCRHVAMKGHFVEIGGMYYLEIDPTYYYTRDGRKKYRHWQEFIRNARIMEKQKEYWSNLELWRRVLTHTGDLLHEDYAFLKFKDFLKFCAPVSIPDQVWNPPKKQEATANQQEFEY